MFAARLRRIARRTLRRFGHPPLVGLALLLALASPALARAPGPATSQHPAREGGEVAAAQGTPQPSNLDDLWARAASLLRAGRDHDALEVLGAIIERDPWDGPAHRERALARWREFLRPAPFSTDPTVATFLSFQGQLCRHTSEPCEAVTQILDDLGRAVTLLDGPARAMALRDRAAVLAERGETAGALTDLDEAVRLGDSGDLHSQRASIRLRLGDRAGARMDLDAALAERDDPGDRLTRAEIRKATGDRRGALVDVEVGLAIPRRDGRVSWGSELAALRRTLTGRREAGAERVVTLRVVGTALRQEADARVRVGITLDRASAQRLFAFTTFHVGSAIELSAGSDVLLSTMLLGPIRDGSMEIALSARGAEGRQEARAFVDRMGRSRLKLRAL